MSNFYANAIIVAFAACGVIKAWHHHGAPKLRRKILLANRRCGS